MTTSIEATSQGIENQQRELEFASQGLLGFENLKRYSLSAYDPQTPFYWLRSIEDPELAFIVMEPRFLVEDYGFDLPDEIATELEIQTSESAFVLVLLTIPEDITRISANLAAPLIFNRQSNRGRQVVLEAAQYPLRLPIFPEVPSEIASESENA
ncbi:flagellar assembly protein FliW [bacterium (Candidatus Blackallbacteria) CG17_big_fil_post_rev_8_21_14_2_50_48_46]|uniref:Flagellar assembly factor FliW n=1 Tax=bacterium (Candidatus Blackallbacteria) CG17_big_fil_post_rev_8_21_14_2_50_48_46 TaxID=2014261 RepID=A0A2M7G3K9_9BACT|nr:MAG: flagellar assembly protein FliW [bacterium (Candidatus Blackallbacteria) CG18_big_fil_WC_8_21_14_2_50_49_26]PIW16445.1 MAG: flagellar assembly protein FliW [bacterium (Candidatus Blackallbacteria) CG17_big_fil_post_rev_8_21_14_2_50_48_46]PIW45953.1 MAG: flagellar assembly protein FliW [bacterium (Candidatus Blackallbacteria) CG13_big_fil_rev_8_21_14_2_50_49_14]